MLFSIIVPCYNVAKYVEQTLDSVLGQSHSDWECVCVDDGSTDKTAELLDRYGEKDSRFIIIHQENGGEGAARNTAIENSRGEYLVLLDGDDLLHCEALTRCAEAINKYPGVDGVCFNKVQGEIIDFGSSGGGEIRYVDLSQEVADKQVWHAYVWQHVYRRELMKDVRFRNYVMSTDATYVAYFLARAKSECVLTDNLYGYRQRAGSIVNSSWTYRKWSDSLHAYREITDLFRETRRGLDREYVRVLSSFLLRSPLLRLRFFGLKKWPAMLWEYSCNVGGLANWRRAPMSYRICSYLLSFGSRMLRS